jgi:hypothetical protein
MGAKFKGRRRGLHSLTESLTMAARNDEPEEVWVWLAWVDAALVFAAAVL